MSGGNSSCDVLVIGAGASGGALAWSLASRGASVICLEQGDVGRPGRDAQVTPRLGGSRSPRLEREPRRCAAARSTTPVTNLGENPVDCFFYAAVGGSTIGFGAHVLAPAAVRLPHPHAGRVRGRLADRIRGPGALLRRQRARSSAFPVSPGTRPGRRVRPRRCRRLAGRAGPPLARGLREARLVLVAAGQRASSAATTAAGPACTNRSHCAFGCPRALSRHCRRHLLAEGARRRRRRCGSTAGSARSTLDDSGRAGRGRYYDDAEGRRQQHPGRAGGGLLRRHRVRRGCC